MKNKFFYYSFTSIAACIFLTSMLFFSTSAYAASYTSGFWQYEDDSSTGGISITEYTGIESTLTIPSKINGKTVTSISSEAFTDNQFVKILTIPSTVTKIYDKAFYKNTVLTTVTIPDSVKTLGSSAFQNDTSLVTVNLGKGVAKIENSLFLGCTSLKNFKLTTNIQSIGENSFYKCSSLTSITLPSSLKTIDHGAFYCSGLNSISIPDSITSIGSFAFSSCSNLSSASIGNGLTVLSSSIFSWTALKSISIPSNIERIESNAFCACSDLESITFTRGLDYIGDTAFYICSSLKSITFPPTLRTINGSTGDYPIFKWCSELKYISLPNSIINLSNLISPDQKSSIIFKVYDGSYASKYCKDNDYLTELLTPVYATSIKFKQTSVNLGIGETINLNPVIYPSNSSDSITYSFSADGYASISNNRYLTATKTGSIVLFSTTTSGKKTTLTINIKSTPSSISFKKSSLTLGVGETYLNSVTILPSGSGGTMTYSGSNSSASISSTGKITALSPGKATFICTSYNGLTSKCYVEIKAAPTSVSFEKNTLSVKPGSYSNKITISSGSICNTYICSSSNSNVATVDRYGKITAKKYGTATLKITTFNGKYATCKISVIPPQVTSLSQNSASTASIKMTWKSISGVTAYEIYRASSKSGTYTKIATTKGNISSYTNSSLASGKGFYYKVRAIYTTGSTKLTGSFSNLKRFVTKPSIPYIKVTPKTSKATISWNKISGADGYIIYMASSKNGTYKQIKKITSGSTINYTKTNLTKNKYYYFKIKAYKTNSSGTFYYSSYSLIKSGKIK